MLFRSGQNHALARKSDGTVWTWGANGNGQLGNNSTTNSALPVQVSGLSGVVAVTAGESSSFALKSDGTVWAWGNNGNGQLGDNSTTQRLVPVQVTGLSGVSAIAAGRYHVAALKTDGTVWAWGYNCDGQLGNGTTSSCGSANPVPVQSAISGVVALSAGAYYVQALKTDGTVWAWGYNSSGQLGDGTTTARSWPALINGAAGIAALASGYESAYLVRSDGAVFAVGYNTDGELGNGTTNSSSTTSLVQAYLGGSQLTLTSSANPAQVGAAVTLTATLTGSSPTGTVTFKDGATVLATVPLSAGSAAYSTNSLTEGVHRITAEYSGDAVNNPEVEIGRAHV